jgi:hypothetical protein
MGSMDPELEDKSCFQLEMQRKTLPGYVAL